MQIVLGVWLKVVKGVSRRVIVVKSPDRRLFDEAIFIVKEDALKEGGVTGEEIIRQAQEVAGRYVRSHLEKGWLTKVPAPAFAAFGAAVTAVAWVVAQYVL